MAKRKRLSREAPVRTAPIRNGVLGAPHAPTSSNGAGFTTAGMLDKGIRTAQRAAHAANAAATGAVERGVETAYTVIDDYMMRGRQAANRHQERNGRPGMNDEQQRYGPSWGAGAGPMSPVMAPWFQMMRLWTDAMTAFVGGGGGPAGDFMQRMMGSPTPPRAKT